MLFVFHGGNSSCLKFFCMKAGPTSSRVILFFVSFPIYSDLSSGKFSLNNGSVELSDISTVSSLFFKPSIWQFSILPKRWCNFTILGEKSLPQIPSFQYSGLFVVFLTSLQWTPLIHDMHIQLQMSEKVIQYLNWFWAYTLRQLLCMLKMCVWFYITDCRILWISCEDTC